MILTMAVRNLSRQRRRSILLGSAVAFAVFVMSLSTGFTAGMNAAVQDNMTMTAGGHVLVTGYLRSPTGRVQTRMNDDGSLATAIGAGTPGILSVSPLVAVRATVVFGSREQQMTLRGIDWDRDRLYRSNLTLLDGSIDDAVAPRSIVLGRRAAERFGLGLGDSLLARFQTASGQQNVTEFSLAAIYDDASSSGLPLAFTGFADLRGDLNLASDALQSYAIFLRDASAAPAAGRTLRAFLDASPSLEGIPVVGTGEKSAATGGTTGGTFGGAASGSQGPAGRAQAGSAPRSGPGQNGAAPGTLASSALPAAAESIADAPATDTIAGSAPGSASDAPTEAASSSESSAAGGAAASVGADPEAPAQPGLEPGSRLLRITDIEELSGQAAAVLGTIQWIGAAVFAVMLALSAAGIANTYRMVLLERTREIGTLRCIGFRRRQVFRMFVAEAAIIAAAGSLAGLLISIPAGYAVGWIPFDTAGELAVALSRGHLLFRPTAVSILATVLPVIVMAALAASGPAKRAASLVPAEALRTVT